MIDLTSTPKTGYDEVQIATSDDHQIKDLIRFCKGWHKFAPFVGACLLEALHDELSAQALRTRITTEIQEDGAQLRHLSLSGDGNLQIDATYA